MNNGRNFVKIVNTKKNTSGISDTFTTLDTPKKLRVSRRRRLKEQKQRKASMESVSKKSIITEQSSSSGTTSIDTNSDKNTNINVIEQPAKSKSFIPRKILQRPKPQQIISSSSTTINKVINDKQTTSNTQQNVSKQTKINSILNKISAIPESHKILKQQQQKPSKPIVNIKSKSIGSSPVLRPITRPRIVKPTIRPKPGANVTPKLPPGLPPGLRGKNNNNNTDEVRSAPTTIVSKPQSSKSRKISMNNKCLLNGDRHPDFHHNRKLDWEKSDAIIKMLDNLDTSCIFDEITNYKYQDLKFPVHATLGIHASPIWDPIIDHGNNGWDKVFGYNRKNKNRNINPYSKEAYYSTQSFI